MPQSVCVHKQRLCNFIIIYKFIIPKINDYIRGRRRAVIYLSLYRKYRPRTFEDVVSQPYITRTLQNQLKTGQTAHAYLFTGSRGTGKTTCAQILAKALNCRDLKDGNPCLECEACRMIDKGTPDITEIDAASNNGVDDIRALRDEIAYSPVSCRYRVYIIDEVHMLSASAFNALLKTVEEPPPHVVFILATTESHKVPATVVSRCQRFEFSRISASEGAGRLLKIASSENIKLDSDAANLISRLSDGGMRDAINLLDTCAAANNECVTVETVSECAGIAGKEHLFQISEAVLEKDCASALGLLDRLHKRSKDMGRLIDELIYHYRSLMLLKIMPESDASEIISVFPQDMADYKSLCGKMTQTHIMRVLGILEECFEKLGRSRERRLLTEMCFIRLCSPMLDDSQTAVLSRIEELERIVSGGFSATKNESEPKNIPEKPKQREIIQQEKANEDKPVYIQEQDFNDIPMPVPPPEGDGYVSYAEPADTVSRLDENIKTRFNENSYTGWADVLNELPPFLSGMLEDADASVDIEAGEMAIQGNEIIKGILENPENKEKLIVAARRVSDGKIQRLKFTEVKNTASKAETDPVQEFLSLLKAEGVEVKTR